MIEHEEGGYRTWCAHFKKVIGDALMEVEDCHWYKEKSRSSSTSSAEKNKTAPKCPYCGAVDPKVIGIDRLYSTPRLSEALEQEAEWQCQECGKSFIIRYRAVKITKSKRR